MDVELGFRINWISVAIFLVLAIAIASHARHVSGGWMRPWISIKPLWWFLLLFFVPPLGLLLLIVNLVVHRHTREPSLARVLPAERPVISVRRMTGPGAIRPPLSASTALVSLDE